MRNSPLLASVLLFLAAPTAAQWSDNFDGYTANQQLSNVGGWFGWDNVPSAAGTVDGMRSRSFPNSLRVGATTDAVHPNLGATSGKWTLTAWQYIPTGGLAGGDVYFIGNNVYNHGGPYTWTTELKCSGTTVVDDLRANTPQPLVFDRWVEFRAEIDLDANTVAYYYNGGLISQGVYTVGGGPRALANLDLFSTGGVCNWDDISLAWRGDGLETYAALTLLSNVGGWFGWDNAPAAAATVDATRARTGTNSLLVGATTDAVRPGIGLTSGRWNVSAWLYIPTGGLVGGDVYFIANSVYNHGGPYTWTTELKCSGTTIVDDLRPTTPQPLVFDQWVELRADVDLDANTVAYYYNGGRISRGAYTILGGPRALANIDLFSTGGTCNWDDICFQKISPPPCYETNIGTPLAMGDDTRVARPLGFTFPFPGGSTTDIGICSNGFIWLDGVQASTDFSNSVAEFLGSVQATPRICAAWRDFDAGAAGSDDVYFTTFPGRAVITWHNIVRFQGTQPMTVQCQLLADGSVYVYFDANYDLGGGTANAGRTLIGIKAQAGLNVPDPGNTDYSAALPISTTVPNVYEFFGDSVNFDLRGRCIRFQPNTVGGYDVAFRFDCGASAIPYGVACPMAAPCSLTTSARPVLGTTFTWDVINVPANTTAAAIVLGVGNANVNLTPFGFTGCSSYTTLDLPVALPFTPPTASLAATVPIQPQIIGLALYSQAAIVENTNTLYTSNGVALVFGKD